MSGARRSPRAPARCRRCPARPRPPSACAARSAEGNSVQKGDTLICTDIRLNKECWFLKEKNGDVMRVIKVQGFQYKNDVMNKQKILRQEKAVTAEIYDLLSQYPVFYITRHFVLNSKKERYITELFSWNDDIKKRIYYKKK